MKAEGIAQGPFCCNASNFLQFEPAEFRNFEEEDGLDAGIVAWISSRSLFLLFLSHFPACSRHSPREFINRSDSFCTLLAGRLLSAMVEKIQDLANKNCNSAAQILQFVVNIEVWEAVM